MRRFEEFPSSDFTGTLITADKPVAVFSGADCQNMPADKPACDHMEQQLYPFRNWGTSYVGAVTQPPPQGSTSYGDIWTVLASQDGTTVTFEPSSVHAPITLSAGKSVRFRTSSHFKVSSQDLDHPILLTQFMVGQNATGSTMGDPSMILATPTEQYRASYAFSTPSSMAKDYVNIVRPSGTTVTLDGQPVSGPWVPVGGSGFEVARVLISDGAHRVVADRPVGVTVYGYDEYVSYGYPGGLDLKQTVVINPGG